MAKKFNSFPAKAVIYTTTVTSSFMFAMFATDEGIRNIQEFDVLRIPSVFQAFVAEIDEVWYNKHKKHNGIKIENYETIRKRIE